MDLSAMKAKIEKHRRFISKKTAELKHIKNIYKANRRNKRLIQLDNRVMELILEYNRQVMLEAFSVGERDSIDTGEIQSHQFDYNSIDKHIAEFLQKKESNMREIVGKAYTELGRELYEAQQELAKHGYGCFEEWYTSLGFKKQSVYNYINRYSFVQRLDNQKDIESFEELPAPLQYAVSNPNAESTSAKAQAKQAVLDGEVKTLKEYKELVKRLEELEAIERNLNHEMVK